MDNKVSEHNVVLVIMINQKIALNGLPGVRGIDSSMSPSLLRIEGTSKAPPLGVMALRTTPPTLEEVDMLFFRLLHIKTRMKTKMRATNMSSRQRMVTWVVAVNAMNLCSFSSV